MRLVAPQPTPKIPTQEPPADELDEQIPIDTLLKELVFSEATPEDFITSLMERLEAGDRNAPLVLGVLSNMQAEDIMNQLTPLAEENEELAGLVKKLDLQWLEEVISHLKLMQSKN